MVIVMEYVEGSSLGELVRARGPLDDLAAARVWSGLAGALDAAHTRGVMHRDVKPGNVVVDQAGLAHLIDFGIARRTGDATMTMAGLRARHPGLPGARGGLRGARHAGVGRLAARRHHLLRPHRAPAAGRARATRCPGCGPRPRGPRSRTCRRVPRTSRCCVPRWTPIRRRRPPLRAVQRTLEDWLRRAGHRPDGPVSAGAQAR